MSFYRGPCSTFPALAFATSLALAVLPTARSQTEQAGITPADHLNERYVNGWVAQAEDKIITVEDVRQAIAQYLPEIQRSSRNQKEFDQKLEELQESLIQDLIDRALIVKEFYKVKDGDEENRRSVPSNYIDNDIAERIISDFDGDRSKFLAWLRSQGKTQKEYRRDVEEEIIYNYMRQQQAKSATTISPVKIEEFYNENKDKFIQEDQVYLRLIQFSRGPNETDDALRAKAQEVIDKLKAGGKFDEIAKQYGTDPKRTKGGDYGWQKRSDLNKALSDVIFGDKNNGLKKGQHSEPVVLPEGSFVLYAEDRKEAGIKPLDEVRDQIEQILKTQNARQAQERWLEKLRRSSYVKHFN